MTQAESKQIGALAGQVADMAKQVSETHATVAVLVERSHTPLNCPISAVVGGLGRRMNGLTSTRDTAVGGGRVILWVLTFLTGGSILGTLAVIYWVFRLARVIQDGGG